MSRSHSVSALNNNKKAEAEKEREREREEKTFGNLLDLAQRIDICSWNVLEAKVSQGKI